MPDLSKMIGEEVGLRVEKSHIEQIIRNSAKGLRTLIDLAITPGQLEKLDKLRTEVRAKQQARE